MKHYTVEDGLPSNNVYTVYRDSKGFLWFGTEKGIARYNGIKFEVFTTDDGLPDNEIFLFLEDPLGRLWLATYNGELCFYKDGIFHTAKNTPYLKIPSRKLYIMDMHTEYDSSVTIRFYYNSNCINVKNDRIVDLNLSRLKPKASLNGMLAIRKLSDATYKIFCNDSFFTIDTACHVTEVISSAASEQCGWVSLGAQDQRYIYCGGFLATRDLKVIKIFKNELLKRSFTYQVYHNDVGWFVTTSNGILINDSLNILKENLVSYITQDKDGNYWATTLNDGVFEINKDFEKSRLYRDVNKGKIWFAQTVRNNIFFVSSDHVVNHFSKGKVTQLYNFGKSELEESKYSIKPIFFIDSNFRFLKWSRAGYLEIEDLLTPMLRASKYPDNLVSAEVGKSMIRIGDDIYVNTKKRLLRFTVNSLSAKAVPEVISDLTADQRIFGMAKGPRNSVWFSTIENIYKVEKGIKIAQEQFGKISLKSFWFYNNVLIAYTHDNRLLLCDHLDGKMNIEYVAPQKCVWDECYRLDSSHLLMSTNNLYRILAINTQGNTLQYAVITVENPFVPLHAEAICTDSANCYFFKEGSITSISLKSLVEQPTPPQLLFTALKTNQKTYNIPGNVQLSYSESKNIAVSFSILSFSNRNVTCQYSFSKNDRDNWQDLNGDEINLVNPGYGRYVLKIKAKTIMSDYCQPLVCIIDISKPYWAEWWFIVLTVSIGLALIGGIVRYRVLYAFRQKERKHADEIKFMKSEYKALNALMNPHFIFNTLNNVQSLINKNEKLAANKYLRIFANLVRQNMHNISLELISLQSEIEIVSNYLKLEKLRFKELLNYTIKVDEEIELSEIMIPPLLIQPLVENSIKHGILPGKSPDSFISIEIFTEVNNLVIAVKDNGIGIEAAQKRSDRLHESYGLENIRKRIAHLAVIQNKQINLRISEIKDEAGGLQWTIVSVYISMV